jgi:undecaprenyl diphosphate synthase
MDNLENKLKKFEEIKSDSTLNTLNINLNKDDNNSFNDELKFNYQNELERNLYRNKDLAIDLLIRTSGELRLSNFLLYQTRFSLLYFIEKNWPELNYIDFIKIILYYNINFSNHIRNLQELSSQNNFRINQLHNYN